MAAEALKLTTILDVIDKRLIPNSDAKTLRGEVFTDLKLVREMLFGLRKSDLDKNIITLLNDQIWGVNEKGEFFDDDENNRVGGIPLSTWRDSNTKWLDPANGIGNFPFIAYYMLDYQLDKHGNEPSLKGSENKQKRRKHIIENMLYMIEINKGNVNTSKKIFNQLVPNLKKINILCANTLLLTKDKLLSVFGVNQFDVIMGNPPFNSGGVKSSGTKKEDGGYSTIWPQFVLKTKDESSKPFPGSLALLKENGYLCFIHPSSWLHNKDAPGLHNILLNKNIQTIRIYTNFQANEIFKSSGAVRSAYYLLKNTELQKNNKIEIIDIEKSFEKILQTQGDIFQSNNLLLQNVYLKIPRLENNLKSTGILKPKKNYNAGPYKNICRHIENGVEICKTDVKFEYYNQPKIIFKGTSKLYHFDDFNGEYGIFGNWGFYIIDNQKNLRRTAKFLDTNIAKIMMSATKEDQDFIEPKYLPNVNNIPDEIEINDIELCKYFGINPEKVIKYNFYKNNQTIGNIYKNCPCPTSKTSKLIAIKERRHTRKLRRFF